RWSLGLLLRKIHRGAAISTKRTPPSLVTFSVSKTIDSSLISSFAQCSFQLDVKLAAHLRHSLIAKLAKERRWLVIFENTVASLMFEQDYRERRVKSSREFMAGHP